MPLLHKPPKGQWTLGGREGAKHRGQLLTKVAEEDPSYLTFLWEKSLKYLSEGAIDALDEVMEKHTIPRELPKKRKRAK